MNDLHQTIFVADYEETIRFTLLLILRKAGYSVFGFPRSEPTLSEAESIRPDLLITDVLIWTDSGAKLATKVQTMHPNCKVLIFTGAAHPQRILEHNGINLPVLSKPAHPDVLLAAVRELLRT